MTSIIVSRLLNITVLVSGMVASMCAIASTSGEAMLETATPPDSTTTVVALNTLQNGHMLSISTFESKQNTEQTFAFYRDLWPEDSHGPGSMETVVGQWKVISHIENGFLVALQLESGKSEESSGYLSVMQMELSEAMNSVAHLLPPGGELLSTTRHVDINPQAVTWVVRSSAGVGLVSAFYRDTLERDGWKPALVRMSAYPHVLMMNGSDGSIEVIVSKARDGSSIAVVNRVNNHE